MRANTIRLLLERAMLVESGCVLYKGPITTAGYGRIGPALAHRVAYAYWVGPLTPGLVIDHLCRVKTCVHPDHLEQVTSRTNTLRGEGPAARNARKDFCLRCGGALVTLRPGRRGCAACSSGPGRTPAAKDCSECGGPRELRGPNSIRWFCRPCHNTKRRLARQKG